MISRRKFIQNTGAGLFLTAIPYSTNALNNIKKYDLRNLTKTILTNIND